GGTEPLRPIAVVPREGASRPGAPDHADEGRIPMSATGLDVFDRSLQTTNIWLNEMMESLGPDRQLSWHVLGVVLRTLRDRLPADLAAHLGTQLPLIVRGAYYEQFEPGRQPVKSRS